MTSKIDVLDHGFVRLVDSMGSDLSVSRAARVSYDEEWRAGEDEGSDAKLIKYLKKHKHHTPFEAVTFTFEVKAPIFVFRQWHRHRTWSYNELSARYRELPEEFYVPALDKITPQAKANKQGREMEGFTEPEKRLIQNQISIACEDCFVTYRKLLEKGLAKELARSVLPVNTYSHMFATVNLLNLMRFLSLRDHSHAQYEIRVYAEAMRELAKTVAPVSIAAWEEFGA
jgi:thymidylate synthase (FAD)